MSGFCSAIQHLGTFSIYRFHCLDIISVVPWADKNWLSVQISPFYSWINGGWWVMSAIKKSLLPHIFTAASLDDTPGEQMRSDEFTASADVGAIVFHYFFFHARPSWAPNGGTNHLGVLWRLRNVHNSFKESTSVHYYVNWRNLLRGVWCFLTIQ